MQVADEEKARARSLDYGGRGLKSEGRGETTSFGLKNTLGVE